jgi:hypothetical protein
MNRENTNRIFSVVFAFVLIGMIYLISVGIRECVDSHPMTEISRALDTSK